MRDDRFKLIGISIWLKYFELIFDLLFITLCEAYAAFFDDAFGEPVRCTPLKSAMVPVVIVDLCM